MIKKGDNVYIMSGKDRGKTAKIIKVFSKQNRVIVEGINIHMRHMRPRKAGEKGQKVSIPSPVDVSNVMLVCASCKKPSRTRTVRKEGKGVRICVKCGAVAEAISISTAS